MATPSSHSSLSLQPPPETGSQPPVISSRKKILAASGLSAASGFALFLSDYPVQAWPLQLLALVPFLLALFRYADRRPVAALCGCVLGCFFIVPLAFVLRFPFLMGAALALYLVLLWTLLALAASFFVRRPPLISAFSVAAVAVLVEWIDITCVPIWGTAQVFTRVWSAGPWAVQFVSLGGVTLLVFVVFAVQALAVKLWLSPPKDRRQLAAALAIVVGVAAAYDLSSWFSKPAASLRAAAMGWTYDQLPRGASTWPEVILHRFYIPMLEKASSSGAKLIVSPEVGFRLAASQREEILQSIGEQARKHKVFLVVGYFDKERNDNRAVFIDDQGRIRGEYVKTHLIPVFERYKKGKKAPVTLLMRKTMLLGAMICQDDNFTDLARAYGRLKVNVMAVPTNDWFQVRHFHLENAVFRGLENGFGMIRAASNGISAIVDAKGRILASKDHFKEGPGVIVAHLPVEAFGGTPYSELGDWPAVLCALLLVFVGVMRFREYLPTRLRSPSPRCPPCQD